jgi:Transposase DNA-binding/Transposase Tn5 dimerisation domain
MQTPPSDATWAERELATATFGDARLTKRLIRIVSDKLAKPSASIPQASGSWAATKATYNFFASDQISADAIRAAHLDATRRRLTDHTSVLVLQDTTEFDYTSHPATRELGHLDHTKHQGLKVHSALAATPAGVPLGLVHQAVWTRNAASKGQKTRKRPQAERESQRWLTTVEAVQQALPAPTRLIIVADREADIYPLFIAPREQRTELVIRAAYNRGLVGGTRLEQVLADIEMQDNHQVLIPGNGQRTTRTASVQIGWSELQVMPPTDYPKPASAPRPILRLVIVEEGQPPPGVKPLRWLLWTSLAVDSLEQAIAVAELYRQRWLIERYHFVLKSGCGVERLQLETGGRLERALAVCCIVAWRLLWLTYQARVTPDEPCTSVLANHEWQALYCSVHQTPTPPTSPPSLREAVRLIARLGGFLARKGDGEPGVQTIWRGLTRLDDIAATWLLVRGSDPHPLDRSLMGNG